MDILNSFGGGSNDISDLNEIVSYEQIDELLTCAPQQQLKEFYDDFVVDSTPIAKGTLKGNQVLEQGITESVGGFTIVVKKNE